MKHRKWTKASLVVAALGLILVPVAAIAAGEFTDVADDSVFKADIAWLADSGVTTGAHTVSQELFGAMTNYFHNHEYPTVMFVPMGSHESVAGVTSGTSERG